MICPRKFVAPGKAVSTERQILSYLPFELMILGSGLTVTTSTSAVVLEPFANVCAASKDIFWMMLDLFRPVPAAAAPAF